jgi:hypothetical protein
VLPKIKFVERVQECWKINVLDVCGLSNLFFVSHFATFSPISILPALIAFFIPLAFLQIVQVYINCILFVDLDFLFQLFIGGFEYLPLFPVPLFSPRAFALEVDPRDIGWTDDLDFCFATLTFCNVLELQYGQYLFTSCGNFILGLTYIQVYFVTG